MSDKNKIRIDYLDTAKGLGIILVCLGHACTNKSVTSDCAYAGIIRFVTLFHMALFFFVNGMLYNEKHSANPIQGIWKKIKSYYVPFVKYNLLFWVFHNIFSYSHLISGKLDPKDYPYEGLRAFGVSFLKSIVGFRQRFAGAMWFLESLLVLSVVFIICDYLVTKICPRKRVLVLSCLVIAIVLINRLLNLSYIPHLPESLTQMIYWGLNGLLFFYLGYLYKLFDVNEKLIKWKYYIGLGTGAIVLLTTIIMKPSIVSVITNTGISIWRYFVFSVVCSCGIIMTLFVSQFRWIGEWNWLKTLGKYSLHIMCLQFLAFKSVSIIIIKVLDLPMERLAEYPVVRDVDGLWFIAYTIAACILPCLFAKACEFVKDKAIQLKRSIKK